MFQRDNHLHLYPDVEATLKMKEIHLLINVLQE